MDVTTLKTTPAGTWKFAKAIQEVSLIPEIKNGVQVGYKEMPVGDPVTALPWGREEEKTVRVGEEFEPTLFWLGRYCRFIDGGNVVQVKESDSVGRLRAIEELKAAITADDFDALKAPLAALGFKRPKAKADAFDFAAAAVRLANEDL